ncbi:benzoate/H(+) symporter BenE family transporter [Xylophilus rhododendri]|uniref:Benzoate/H(+) symporter BenE family transporter n=1 Tax=Xylophilus rhododendri TaxID=2697032 RepID=A0A857J7B1_9BURK|nr:benzoate/H(+) symporter BenE family transporter [Xylophilus rhododendri]QHI98685.1 benzoate/H(+) symporter BenE family transporter [Xylophilus rhododendri]
MRLIRDFSLSAFTAGVVAVLVGFTSSAAIVFQAARALGGDEAVVSSWIWAIGIGVGLCSMLPSLWWRKPVMVAWSTPGAAVLVMGASGHSLAQAVGAFLAAAALILLVGVTGWFEKMMDRIPPGIAAALLAGVLARFGMQAFSAAEHAPLLVVCMVAAYLVARRFWPRYAVLASLVTGVVCAALQGQLAGASVPLTFARPVFVAPEFSWSACIGLGLPLFIVTMASQNLPGVAAIRAAGYRLPVSRLVSMTGVATLLLAPFGAYALNLSAITAAICMGPEAHPDPERRYPAAVTSGALYIVLGLLGATVVALLTAFPPALIACIAGLALLGTIGNGLAAAVEDATYREAAVITFLVTLSGVVLFGIGSAFWGVVAGTIALFVQKYRSRAPARL